MKWLKPHWHSPTDRQQQQQDGKRRNTRTMSRDLPLVSKSKGTQDTTPSSPHPCDWQMEIERDGPYRHHVRHHVLCTREMMSKGGNHRDFGCYIFTRVPNREAQGGRREPTSLMSSALLQWQQREEGVDVQLSYDWVEYRNRRKLYLMLCNESLHPCLIFPPYDGM